MKDLNQCRTRETVEYRNSDTVRDVQAGLLRWTGHTRMIPYDDNKLFFYIDKKYKITLNDKGKLYTIWKHHVVNNILNYIIKKFFS